MRRWSRDDSILLVIALRISSATPKNGDGGRLAYRDLPLRGNAFGITSASVATVDPRGLHRASVAGGIKWNFAGTVLLTANVMLPLNDAGLRDHLTPIIGLDWGF